MKRESEPYMSDEWAFPGRHWGVLTFADLLLHFLVELQDLAQTEKVP